MKHPTFDSEKRDRLFRFKELIERYHTALDLMSDAAISDWDAHVAGALDIASELATSPPPDRGDILDLGAGAGLPGVVVAIALPDRRVHLVERRRRRATFLRLAVAELGLDTASVHAVDVRELRRTDIAASGVGAITAQAVASFDDVYRLTCHLHGPTVTFVSRKGNTWKSEIEALERRIEHPIDARSRPTEPRGTLVAFDAPGGRACPSSV